MARVLVATQPWGILWEKAVSRQLSVPVSGQLAAINTTVYSASTGAGTISAAAFVTNADGLLPGYVDPGQWVLTINAVAQQVDAVSGASVLSLESTGGPALTTQVGRTAYNAKNYGLAGDGVTSDQTAATSMWSAIPAGSRLHFPRGTYLFSTQNLPASALEIAGDGQGATTLKVLAASTLAGGLLQFTDSNDVIVRDLSIDLNKANTPDGGADGAQMGLYFYTTIATRRGRVQRVRVLNGERHGIVIGATGSLPGEVDLIDVDVEDCDSIGLFASYATRCKVVRGNYLRNGLDNLQFLRSSGFTVEDVIANGSLGGHGVVAGDMCSEFKFIGGDANSNNQSGWVASVRATAFQMLGQRAKANGQLGLTVDLRNHNVALNGALTNVATTIPVTVALGLIADYATAGTIRIGTERITYTGISGSSFTGCTRGAEGSVAQSHLTGAVVLSEKFHDSLGGLVSGYLLSGNGSHGLYHQYGTDLTIGGGACRGNAGDGMLVVAQRAAISGVNSYANTGRGLAFANDAGGSGTGDHRVRACRLYINTGLNYEDNAADPSLADLDGSGTPEAAVKAAVGSTYRRKGGGAATSFYVKETGAGNTGWVAK